VNDTLNEQLQGRLISLNAEAEARQEANRQAEEQELTNDLRYWVKHELGPHYAEYVTGSSVTFGTITLEARRQATINLGDAVVRHVGLARVYYIGIPCPKCLRHIGCYVNGIRDLAWAVKNAAGHKCPRTPAPREWSEESLRILHEIDCHLENH